jgi:hypothetical protein
MEARSGCRSLATMGPRSLGVRGPRGVRGLSAPLRRERTGPGSPAGQPTSAVPGGARPAGCSAAGPRPAVTVHLGEALDAAAGCDRGRLRRSRGGELTSWRSCSMLVARCGRTDRARLGCWGSRAGMWGTLRFWPPELPAWKPLAFRRPKRRSWPQRWLPTPRSARVLVRTPLAPR